MVEAWFVRMKGGHHRENGMAVLAGKDAPRGETLAVADAVDVVDDRHFRIAAQQEIGVQRMGRPVIDGAAGRDQRLTDHLAAEDALPADLRAAAAKEILLQRFEVEDVEEILDGGGHWG